MNKRIKKKKLLMENKWLCKRYPFLIPRNHWTGVKVWDGKNKGTWRYARPYSFTELDTMPRGWAKAFGIKLCEELREELIKYNYLNKYRILDIKEKYGMLCWYDTGYPADSKVDEIIQFYEDLSAYTCIRCGRPGEIVNNNGWYEPLCDKCREEVKKWTQR